MFGSDVEQPVEPNSRNRWTRWAPIAGVGGLVMLSFVAVLVAAHIPALWSDPPALDLVDVPVRHAVPADDAGSARVVSTSRVLGVRAGGRYRAYMISGLTEMRHHVVNDVVGGVPVAVTYCDRENCARVYAAPGQVAPTNLAVGGYQDSDGMLLRIGRYRYSQKSGLPIGAGDPPFPYAAIDVEDTTWGEWRKAHPDSDIVVGGDV